MSHIPKLIHAYNKLINNAQSVGEMRVNGGLQLIFVLHIQTVYRALGEC